MKKFTLTALTALIISSSAIAASEAGSGTVYFKGEVSSKSCTISVNGGDNDATVYLPVVNVDELTNNTPAKPTPFNIVLSKCAGVDKTDASKKLKVSWTEATMADESKGYLANTADQTSAAKNVYIAMFDNGKVIIPGADIEGKNNVQAQTVNDNDGATFSYTVGYLTDSADKATAGNISSEAVYTVSYE